MLVFEQTFDYRFWHRRLSANSQEYERLRDIVKPHTARSEARASTLFMKRQSVETEACLATLSSKIVLYKHGLSLSRSPRPATGRSPLSRYNVAEARLTGVERGEAERLGRVEPPCSSIFMSAECAGFEPIYRLCSARMYAGTYACVYTYAYVYVCVCVYRYVGICRTASLVP